MQVETDSHLIRIDLHVHTACSRDSLARPDAIVRWAERRSLDAIAVTDHNTIAGARTLQALGALPLIVGEEVHTREGEIMGLFLREEIPAGLTPAETVRRIKAQGGLVCVPHPFDSVRGSRLSATALEAILADVDIIEVFNARVTHARDNNRAADLAERRGLLAGAGSDAHAACEVGRAYVEMPPYADAESFLASLAQGRIGGSLSSPLVHVFSSVARLAKKVGLAEQVAGSDGR